jgi:F-type H+-transporting ATPase subunit epsilon
LTDKVSTPEAVDPVRVRLELKEVDDQLDHYTGQPGSPEWQGLVARELWAAAQLELYGDPPPATQRPFEEFGPPAPPEEDEVVLPRDAADEEGETSADR